MMTENCIDIRDIPNLIGLSEDDPRRRHLNDCPRCRGVAEAYGLFMEPGDTGDLDDLTAADARLERRLTGAMAAGPANRREPRRRFWLALAAVLAVCALGLATSEILQLRQGELPRVGERLRGDDDPATPTLITTADGLRLAWPDAPPADLHVFLFMGDDLTEVGRLISPQASLVLASGDLPAAAVFCQILAVSQGDTLARSAVVPLEAGRE